MCACQGTAQVNVQRDVTANPKLTASPTPQALPRYREPYDHGYTREYSRRIPG
jgi:hypothetical protein